MSELSDALESDENNIMMLVLHGTGRHYLFPCSDFAPC